ncbi:MAG: hypothetical protein ACK5HP_00985 [Bacilli bacterium]
MKINKIKKLTNGKYKIELDSKKITTYDEIILNNNLLFKKEITNDKLNKIEKETVYYDGYNLILKYISTKLRSKKEIIKYIDNIKIDKTKSDKIIKELEDNGYINDTNFTTAFISDKVNLSNDGPIKIKEYLLEHNIDKNIIDELLNNYESSIFKDKLNKIIFKKLNSNNKYSNYMIKQKLLYELINIGYDKNMINDCLEEIDIDESNMLKKEFDSIYKKLSKKLSEYELKNQIKNKLFQKGYKIENINEIIESNFS